MHVCHVPIKYHFLLAYFQFTLWNYTSIILFFVFSTFCYFVDGILILCWCVSVCVIALLYGTWWKITIPENLFLIALIVCQFSISRKNKNNFHHSAKQSNNLSFLWELFVSFSFGNRVPTQAFRVFFLDERKPFFFKFFWK